MQLNDFVHMFGDDLKRRHGEKIHKLTLHGSFTCPNRDGTLGRGGCTFCNVASFADEQAQVINGDRLINNTQGECGGQDQVINPIAGGHLIKKSEILLFFAFTGVVHRQDGVIDLSGGKGIEQGFDVGEKSNLRCAVKEVCGLP